MFDLPGTGQTEWSGPISFRHSIAALRQGIDALGLSRYALFGHDSGGAIARYVAADDPRVSALLLEDTEIPGHESALLGMLLALSRVPRAPEALFSLMRFRAFRHSLLGFGSCFSDPAYVDGDFAAHFLAPLGDARARHGQLELLRTFDLRFVHELAAVHPRLQMPVLCIWGEQDPYFPVDAARAMVSTLPADTVFATIPEARLFPHEDHPEAVARLVRSFLSESRGDTAHSAGLGNPTTPLAQATALPHALS